MVSVCVYITETKNLKLIRSLSITKIILVKLKDIAYHYINTTFSA